MYERYSGVWVCVHVCVSVRANRFERVYDENATTAEVFERDVAPLMQQVLRGINTTIFAYGHTGAGKTFTMEGNAANPGAQVHAYAYVHATVSVLAALPVAAARGGCAD